MVYSYNRILFSNQSKLIHNNMTESWQHIKWGGKKKVSSKRLHKAGYECFINWKNTKFKKHFIGKHIDSRKLNKKKSKGKWTQNLGWTVPQVKEARSGIGEGTHRYHLPLMDAYYIIINKLTNRPINKREPLHVPITWVCSRTREYD